MSVPDLHLAGIVDPARYSDRAVAVVEIPQSFAEEMSDDLLDEMKDGIEEYLGMRVLLLCGARLARIEEPNDG